MSNVFLVHRESGEYSEWTFIPLAVFTTREKAVEWIEGQRVALTDCMYSDCYRLANDRQKVTAYGHPSCRDGETWTVFESEDGTPVSGWKDPSWFIDELGLDPKEEQE